MMGLALLLWLLCSLILLAKEKCRSKASLPRQADVLLVLGAKMRSSNDPGPIMLSRLETALTLYLRGVAPHIVLSGGQVKGEHCAEADAMAEYLQQRGVPASALTLEDSSLNTWQNFTRSAPILHTMQVRSVVVVTSDFHLIRALYIARRHLTKTKLYSAAAKTPDPWLRLLNRQREMLGWCKYWQCEILNKMHKKS